MARKTNLFLLVSIISLSAFAQLSKFTDERTLFTIDGKPVSVKEFEYVYTKNNINNSADYSEKSLREYLDLYEKFRLQVREAEAMKLDTIKALNDELAVYQGQLANTYLVDRGIMADLIKEAYDRMQEEIRVSHILVQLKPEVTGKDTAAAYKKIMDLRKRCMKEDFGKVAFEASEDLSAKTNRGDIGWITAFKTIYGFENKLYATKPGEVSMPFRTEFGYHIIKVSERRANPGEVKTAQIFLSMKQVKSVDVDTLTTYNLVQDIYKQLANGTLSWDSAVVKYSQDNFTKQKKGELPWMQANAMLPEYANAAFTMKDGDISKPVRTALGWHIIKRMGIRPLASFSDMQADLKNKVSRDKRSDIARTTQSELIKKQYGFNENKAALTDVQSKIDTTFMNTKWKAADKTIFVQNMFTIGKTGYSQLDFVNYLEKNQKIKRTNEKNAVIAEMYGNFVRDKVFEYKAARLPEEDADFAATMKEYREGIYIFDLRDKMVWKKAVNDTTGLKNYWQQNKMKWLYGPRLDVTIYSCTDSALTKGVQKMIAKKKTAEQITAKLNVEGATGKVSVMRGKYEKGAYDLLKPFNFTADEAGKSITIYDAETKSGKGATVIYVNALVGPEPKELKDTKGYVVSDYQDFLEKQWIETLRTKYPIVENTAVLNSLIKN